MENEKSVKHLLFFSKLLQV